MYDTLYIVETYVGTQKRFVLSTTPKIADRWMSWWKS